MKVALWVLAVAYAEEIALDCQPLLDPLRLEIASAASRAEAEKTAIVTELQKVKRELEESIQSKTLTEQRLATVEATSASEKSDLNKMISRLEKSLEEAQSSLIGERAAMDLVEDLKAQVNLKNEALRGQSEEFAGCRASLDAAHREFNGLRNSHDAKVITLKSQIKSLEEQIRNAELDYSKDKEVFLGEIRVLKAQLEDAQAEDSVIFSKAQAERYLSQMTTLGKAFFKSIRNRIISLIGADSSALISLQTKVWYNKAMDSLYVITQPTVLRSQELHKRYLQEWTTPVNAVVRRQASAVVELVKAQQPRVVAIVGGYMGRVVSNLSAADPEIRNLFPENFVDRLCAFGFLVVMAHLISGFVGWLLATFIRAPLWYMLGISRPSRKQKKKTSKPTVAVAKKLTEKAADTTTEVDKRMKSKRA